MDVTIAIGEEIIRYSYLYFFIWSLGAIIMSSLLVLIFKEIYDKSDDWANPGMPLLCRPKPRQPG